MHLWIHYYSARRRRCRCHHYCTKQNFNFFFHEFSSWFFLVSVFHVHHIFRCAFPNSFLNARQFYSGVMQPAHTEYSRYHKFKLNLFFFISFSFYVFHTMLLWLMLDPNQCLIMLNNENIIPMATTTLISCKSTIVVDHHPRGKSTPSLIGYRFR